MRKGYLGLLKAYWGQKCCQLLLEKNSKSVIIMRKTYKNSMNTCFPYLGNRFYMHIVSKQWITLNLSNEWKDFKTAARKGRDFEVSQLENVQRTGMEALHPTGTRWDLQYFRRPKQSNISPKYKTNRWGPPGTVRTVILILGKVMGN